jgi:hypothetical protein
MSRVLLSLYHILTLSNVDLAAQKVLIMKTEGEGQTQKFFMVETEESNLAGTGKDYQEVAGRRSLDYVGHCEESCTGKCRKDVKNGLFFPTVTYNCEEGVKAPPPPPPPPPPPALTTTQNIEGCKRTPRNAKKTKKYVRKLQKKSRKQNGQPEKPWGFWLGKGRTSDGNSFCCVRGPRTGKTVRSPRKCGV